MVEYIQSNDDSGNMALYAGIAATAAVGGAALAYRMSDPAYKDKERTKGKIAAGQGKNQGVDVNNIRKQEVNNMMKKLAPDATSKVGGLKSLANAVIGMGPLTARGREGLEGMAQRGIEKNYEPSMASTQRGYDNRSVDGGKMRDLLYETHSKSALSAYGGKEYTPVTAERLLDEMHKQNPDSLLAESDARKMVNRVEKDRLKMDSFMDTIHDKGYDVDEAFKMFSKENPALANSGEGTRTMFNNEWDMRKGNQGEMGKLIHDKEMAHRAALDFQKDPNFETKKDKRIKNGEAEAAKIGREARSADRTSRAIFDKFWSGEERGDIIKELEKMDIEAGRLHAANRKGNKKYKPSEREIQHIKLANTRNARASLVADSFVDKMNRYGIDLSGIGGKNINSTYDEFLKHADEFGIRGGKRTRKAFDRMINSVSNMSEADLAAKKGMHAQILSQKPVDMSDNDYLTKLDNESKERYMADHSKIKSRESGLRGLLKKAARKGR